MNKRIDEIDKQTWAEIAKLGRPVKWLDYRDKFAELLICECANRASWAQDTNEADIGGEVLKCFGVEE